MNPLYNFFYPKSICIAGAIAKEKSIGREMLRSIRDYGYTGKVFPVNHKLDEALGYKVYHYIEEIEDNIDLGIIIIPKQFVKTILLFIVKEHITQNLRRIFGISINRKFT